MKVATTDALTANTEKLLPGEPLEWLVEVTGTEIGTWPVATPATATRSG